MTIYNIGSTYYLGNIKYQNSISYPLIKSLVGHPHASISAEITALLTAAGLPSRYIFPQADFDAFTNFKNFLTFGTNGDIDDRYTFQAYRWDTATGGSSSTANNCMALYNDSGYTGTSGALSSTNNLLFLGNGTTFSTFAGLNIDKVNIGSTASEVQWMGNASASHLALACYQHFFDVNNYVINFWYAGIHNPVNAESNYYSASNITKSILISGLYDTKIALNRQNLNARHYIANAGKDVLRTGFAEYSLSGSTSQWGGTLMTLDNNPNLNVANGGYPTIGIPKGLVVLEGGYDVSQKPYKVTGDNSGKAYLPIGQWTANRKLAMEVYSA